MGNYMTPAEVAETYRLAVGTLANWRSNRVGPPYVKTPAGRILYAVTEVERWITSGRMVAA